MPLDTITVYYDVVTAIVFFFQTLLLLWYAIETRSLRKAAEKQLNIIQKQHEEMQKQNMLVTKQAEAAMAELKDRQKEVILEAEPALSFHQTFHSTEANTVCILMKNIKSNVVYQEFRCEVDYKIQGVQQGSEDERMWVISTMGQQSVKVGVLYKTTRSENRQQVFRLDLQTGRHERLDYEFEQLPASSAVIS